MRYFFWFSSSYWLTKVVYWKNRSRGANLAMILPPIRFITLRKNSQAITIAIIITRLALNQQGPFNPTNQALVPKQIFWGLDLRSWSHSYRNIIIVANGRLSVRDLSLCRFVRGSDPKEVPGVPDPPESGHPADPQIVLRRYDERAGAARQG